MLLPRLRAAASLDEDPTRRSVRGTGTCPACPAASLPFSPPFSSPLSPPLSPPPSLPILHQPCYTRTSSGRSGTITIPNCCCAFAAAMRHTATSTCSACEIESEIESHRRASASRCGQIAPELKTVAKRWLRCLRLRCLRLRTAAADRPRPRPRRAASPTMRWCRQRGRSRGWRTLQGRVSTPCTWRAPLARWSKGPTQVACEVWSVSCNV